MDAELASNCRPTTRQVDVVASTFTVTADRATQVRFVEPYYYSAGAQLFIPKRSENLYASRVDDFAAPTSSWDTLIGDSRMCLLENYFFTPRL